MSELRNVAFSFLPIHITQLLPMTDVTDMQIVPAVLPIQMGASGVMTRNAFQPTVTAVWLVFVCEW